MGRKSSFYCSPTRWEKKDLKWKSSATSEEEIFFSSLSKLNQSSSASDDVKSTADEWKICYKYRRHKKEKRQAGVYISLSVIAVNICRAKQWTRSRLVHAIWKKNYFHFRSFMLVSSSGAGDMFTCSILFIRFLYAAKYPALSSSPHFFIVGVKRVYHYSETTKDMRKKRRRRET